MDNLGFWLSKILWAIFSPTHFIVILLILSFIFFKSPWAKAFVRGLAAVYFFIALLFPVGDWALVPLEQCTADQGMPMNVDGVLVLGGAVDARLSDVRKAIAFTDSSDRIFALLKLIKQYPNAQFIYSGGSNSLKGPGIGEAEYVKQLLDDLGVKPANMIFQSQSRNTLEDALLTKDIWGKTPKQSWLLVTSAFHMPRSYGLFQMLAQKTDTMFYPYAVDYKTPGKFKFEMRVDMLQTLLKLDLAAHEYTGLIVNALLKRSESFLPCTAKINTLQ